jgi:hypothetical protein
MVAPAPLAPPSQSLAARRLHEIEMDIGSNIDLVIQSPQGSMSASFLCDIAVNFIPLFPQPDAVVNYPWNHLPVGIFHSLPRQWRTHINDF